MRCAFTSNVRQKCLFSDRSMYRSPTYTWKSLRSWLLSQHPPDPGCGSGMWMTLLHPDVEGLLHHLNSVRPTIKFNMEVEEGGSLPLLDTKITRKEDGKLDITVYRKQTHTDRYLHFRSHHPTREEGYGKVSLRPRQVHCAAGTEPREEETTS